MQFVERERSAFTAHRASLRGAPLSRDATRGTFLHGFLLPFSLIVATLRDGALRLPYLRLVAARIAVVAALGLVFFSGRGASPAPGKTKIVLHIELDDRKSAPPVPVEPAQPTRWGWVLALLACLTAGEAVVVFFSRRWDDWLSFHASRLAGIKPEDESPPDRKLAFDLKWLYRKMKRRIRGYVVFAAGVPALAPLHLIPAAGPWLFSAAITIWTWYWFGVFAASKSAHAWADEGAVGSPAPIRMLDERIPKRWWTAPLRLYVRIWAWLTRGINPPAATFERSPMAFLGLALARALLALPGLYVLARPIVPVAAGRLCADVDPEDRFSAR